MRAFFKFAAVSLLLFIVGSPPAAAEATAVQPDCTVQPAGNIITPFMAQRINELKPLYIQAAKAKNVSWLILPPVHYRETALRRDNPANGQGIFQLYSYVHKTHQRFKPSGGQVVPTDQFVGQAQLAIDHLIGKAPGSLANPDKSTVAWAYFGYNGRSKAYFRQAKTYGYKYPFEGSPYVYNLFDAAHSGKLYFIQSDGGRLGSKVDVRPGAFTIYYELLRQCAPNQVPELRNTPTTTGPAPDNAPNPFRGEVVPNLPAEGAFPFPWFAFGAFAAAPVLMLTFGIARRTPFGSTAWVMAAVMAPTFIHFDDLIVETWPFLGDLTLGRGLLIGLGGLTFFLLVVGYVRTVEATHTARITRHTLVDVLKWCGSFLRRNYKTLGQMAGIVVGMIAIYRFTATGNPAEEHFTLKAMSLLTAVTLANIMLFQRRNSNGLHKQTKEQTAK